MESVAGGHASAIPRHRPGGPPGTSPSAETAPLTLRSAGEKGAGDCEAGETEPGSGRVEPSQLNTLTSLQLNNQL